MPNVVIGDVHNLKDHNLQSSLPPKRTKPLTSNTNTGHKNSGPSTVEPRLNLALPTRAQPGIYSRPLFLTCILALSCAVLTITDSRFYDSSCSFLILLT